MARPKKHPESLVRLQPYLSPVTAGWLAFEAVRTSRPIGEILDELITERMNRPEGPETANFDFAGPLSEPEWSTKASAAGHIPAKEPPEAVRRHPGWRVNSNNVNICVDCNGKKQQVQGKPCPGPKEEQ